MKSRLLLSCALLCLIAAGSAVASDLPAAPTDGDAEIATLLQDLAPPAPNQSYECHPQDPHCPGNDNEPQCHPEDIACYCPSGSTMCLRLRYCILGCINQGYTGGYLDAKHNCICTGGSGGS
ncbi:MAG: hypothetical protein AAF604_24580 [Acidobacteriota bacterium]